MWVRRAFIVFSKYASGSYSSNSVTNSDSEFYTQSCVHSLQQICIWILTKFKKMAQISFSVYDRSHRGPKLRVCVCECHYVCVRVSVITWSPGPRYGLAMVSRLLKKIGLFCKRAL